MNVLSILDRAKRIFLERNAQYRDNYRQMGPLLLALFPNGKIPAITNEADAGRINLMIDCLGKLQRYAYAFEEGGHADSADDLIVYAAMLREQTKEPKSNHTIPGCVP